MWPKREAWLDNDNQHKGLLSMEIEELILIKVIATIVDNGARLNVGIPSISQTTEAIKVNL